MGEVKKLNDSVYELYRPPEGTTPSMELVFFHGFQHGNYEDAHLFTWSSPGDESCIIWPQSWLQEEFPDARILTVSYNVWLHMTNTQLDMYLLVENLRGDLLSAKIGQEPRCPVVLVGHSFGGLVMKALCVGAFSQTGQSNIELKYFLSSLKGFFFYATPHRGVSCANPELLTANDDLRPYVEILSRETARLNCRFDELWKEHPTWHLTGLGESVASRWDTFYGLVVQEGSSRLGPNFQIEPGADHISISRPPTKISRRFTHLIKFLRDIAVDSNNEGPENFQELPKSITGIGETVKDVKKMLGKTTRMGFYGMGGIGKTTLVKALFNDVEHCFDYTCFINEDEIHVEDIVLLNMHYGGRRTAENAPTLKMKMKGRKLLLVLDGVRSSDDSGIVERFLRDIDLHEDSRFVATSRNKEFLATKGYTLHRVEFLGKESSRDLFLTCVPHGRIPPFQEYVDDIVEKCDRLPLTLKVVGEYLNTKTDKVYWGLMLRTLDEARNIAPLDEKLWTRLKITYDSLQKEEKRMFLDAVTVFYRCDLRIAMSAWGNLGDFYRSYSQRQENLDEYQISYWQRLVNFSLVQEGPDGDRTIIRIQNQLLRLGRRISLIPMDNGCIENGYRFWNNSAKAFDILSAEDDDIVNLKEIVALKSRSSELFPADINRAIKRARSMDFAPQKYITISGNKLSKMIKLQYLWLEGFNIDHPLPSKIVYLHLSRMNFSDFPLISRSHRDIIILSLHQIDGFRKLPVYFCRLESLQILSIEGNTNMEGLPRNFGDLVNLKHLSIKLCPTLSRLPKRLVNLKALETLSIGSCSPLLTLPESIGELKTLKVLKIVGYGSESVPDSLGKLSMLRHLRIEWCPVLRSLPDSLGELKALEILTIDSCNSLSGLPNSLENLFELKVIRITGCSSLRRLPQELETLPALENIELNEICLRRVPDLEMITSLRTLRLSWVKTSEFPSLPACLSGKVTEENYTSVLTFSVVYGIFQTSDLGNFQHVPAGILETLEDI